jgi:TM2 domain-containing membrane protein YozV
VHRALEINKSIMENNPSYSGDKKTGKPGRGPDERFCQSCGGIVKVSAERCPGCGLRQGEKLSKAALLLFTFFLGGLGVHKFYTKRNWQGFFYLIFSWTGIPHLIALVEFVIYAFTSSEKLQERYDASGGGTVIAIVVAGIGFIILLGIIAAIAIPQFMTHKVDSYQAAVSAELMNLKSAEDDHYLYFNEYSVNLEDLRYITVKEGVIVEIVSVDEDCFEARGRHINSDEYYYVDCDGLMDSSLPVRLLPPAQ